VVVWYIFVCLYVVCLDQEKSVSPVLDPRITNRQNDEIQIVCMYVDMKTKSSPVDMYSPYTTCLSQCGGHLNLLGGCQKGSDEFDIFSFLTFCNP
jgi:hypothetical protein